MSYENQQQIEDVEQTKRAHKEKKTRENRKETIRQFYKTNK